MGSRATDQSGTYIICLFTPDSFTVFLKGGGGCRRLPFCSSATDVLYDFIDRASFLFECKYSRAAHNENRERSILYSKKNIIGLQG